MIARAQKYVEEEAKNFFCIYLVVIFYVFLLINLK